MNIINYFDNAATSWPKPRSVPQRMAELLAEGTANRGSAGYRMGVGDENTIDSVRKQLADFIGGTDPQRLIFTLNATDALNVALKGVLRHGDHVITTTLEHNSVSRPLQAMADSGLISLTRIDFSPTMGTVDPVDFQKTLTPRTRLVILTHASNVLGTIQPIAEIGKLVRRSTGGGALFLVDAAQTIGTVPIDIDAQFIDLLAFPGHKSLLGPTGTGGLYVNPRIPIEELHPFREGGTGADSSSLGMPRLFPHYLEAGTPNTVGIAGLGAALEYVISQEPSNTLAKERAMLQQIIDTFLANPKFTLYGPKTAGNRVGVVSFNVEGYSPQEAAAILDESFCIAVRPGLQCSPYAHRTLGTFPDGAIRISPGPFTTADDLAALLDALEQLAAAA